MAKARDNYHNYYRKLANEHGLKSSEYRNDLLNKVPKHKINKLDKLHDEVYDTSRSKLFVSGSSKTQSKDSEFFRKKNYLERLENIWITRCVIIVLRFW